MRAYKLIADRFEVHSAIAVGGMAEVFRARDRRTNAWVAVKLLIGEADDEDDRFWREAKLLATMRHPRIVQYVAHGTTEQNRAYLAMEWLEGEDLADRLAQKGLTLGETWKLARAIAEGLAVLHERGIVHRDIKPSNVFLVDGDVSRVKLLDLGVARPIDQSKPRTQSGVMVGTPGYMAPEQARGQKDVDARVDIFATGCVMFECITGRVAFSGDNVAALLTKILLEETPRITDTGVAAPAEIDVLVASLMAKDRDLRPRDGAALLHELERLDLSASDRERRPSVARLPAITRGERKLVSVVMAAAVDGRLDETRDSLSWTALDATDAIPQGSDPRAVAASFGARAEYLADGSLVATLSGRGTATDQVAQAARCALALRSHIFAPALALATGLSSLQRGSFGEVIERAAALIQTARALVHEPSHETSSGRAPILLDETTAGLLDVEFDVGGDERGLFIRGLRPHDGARRTLLGKATPCVGRDRELATLLGLFQEAIAEPVARAVLVSGPPGMGKTRLLTEFLSRVEAGEAPPQIWSARGELMSEGSPFAMLARVVHSACRMVEGEPLPVRQHKLRARVGRHLEGDLLQRVVEFLAEVAGCPFDREPSLQLRAARQDPILMGDQIVRAFEDWARAELREGPVVLLLEDLHWGDLPSIRAVDALLRNLADQPLLVLAGARLDIHESYPGLWEDRSVQEIRLGPLTRRAAERLMKEILGADLHDDLVARIVKQSAGNAFFLEELIRAHVEQRGVPRTVLAMLDARIQRLDPAARRILRAASIFGEVFWRGGVHALVGPEHPQAELDHWLAELQQAEFVSRSQTSRVPGDMEYVFRHALVREAAYGTTTHEDARAAHLRAGLWLNEADVGDPLVLGEHFEKGGDRARATEFYAQAAREALEGNDFAGAKAHGERALTSGAEGAVRGTLLLLLAEACTWRAEYAVAQTWAERAMQELPSASDDWFAAAGERAMACWRLGQAAGVAEVAHLVAAQLSQTNVTGAAIIGVARVAQRQVHVGHADLAAPLQAWLEHHQSSQTDPRVLAAIHVTRATHAMWTGEAEQELVSLEAAAACFERAGDRRNACEQREASAYCLSAIGALEEAETLLRDVIDSSIQLGLSALTMRARQSLGAVLSRQNRFHEASATLREAIAGYARMSDHVSEGIARVYLALSLMHKGSLHEAEEEARRGLPLVQSSPPLRAAALAALSHILIAAGKLEEAYPMAREGLLLYRSLGGIVEGESLVLVSAAEALHAAGETEAAKTEIRRGKARLLTRAAQIQSPARRASFLERIRENAAVLELATRWGVDG